MSILIPDLVFQSIYDITPALLREKGARGVLIDLDGTMAPRRAALPPEELAAFSASLRQAGLRILVLSNNSRTRVARFCEALDVGFISRACKPMQAGFRRAAERLGLELRELAVIGDQIFTDVCGGNRAGALTCYVETLDGGHLWVRLRRRLEHGFICRGRKRMEERKNRE